MDIKTSLEQIGLNKKQVEIYITLLQMGEGQVQEISNKTKIKRTTVYSVLDNLVKKNLVVFVDKGWHRIYYAENPRKVLLAFKEEQHDIQQKEKKYREVLPELASIYNIKAEKPKIRFYEGVEGIKQIYEETLLLAKGAEMLAYGSAVMIDKYFGKEWLNDYWKRRIKRKISVRAILEDSEVGKEYLRTDKENLRQTRLVSKDKFPFTNLINVFGNKVYIISFKNMMGVIIESADVAGTQRAIFELAWLGAEKITQKYSH
ncbi:hypothetical protein A2V71_02205 [Candidatus Berkelbacteria bacterium RBG_13_40_8]|uniref:Transcription regulator TrmB N-terminal domain-containing protein n=1 Tax=Candidatus Berkelbacteria bacterium RBG_13_40_8 TaxID=1797467 RepID=A0A1F5DQ72_9BACT|nr:MAG: hypothetical protein A2V71_02205 [Candidatus Berkelbacteria bacterium RBG_13_40_8]